MTIPIGRFWQEGATRCVLERAGNELRLSLEEGGRVVRLEVVPDALSAYTTSKRWRMEVNSASSEPVAAQVDNSR